MEDKSKLQQTPASPEAERALIGSMIISNPALARGIERIESPDYFHDPKHRYLYNAISNLFNQDVDLDAVTVSEQLEEMGSLEDAGGMGYIAKIVDEVPDPKNISEYIDIVQERYVHRTLIDTCNEIIEMSYSDSGNVDELLDKAEHMLFSIKEERVEGGFKATKNVTQGVFDELDELINGDGETTGLKTGFVDFDQMTSGLKPGQLIILAARPGMGKTSLVLNMLQNICIEQGEPAGMFSLEMSASSLVKRVVASESRVPFKQMQKGKISANDWERVTNAIMRIGQAPLYIDDGAELDIMQMKAKTRRLVTQTDPKLLVVDYMQLMSGTGEHDSRQQEISAISRGLKQIAKEFNVPVLALTQLNRQVEQRNDKRPKPSDLRGSGAIEQDADIISFVYRPVVYSEKEEDEGIAEYIIGKHRNGPTGTVHLTFVDKYMRFENRAHESQEEEIDEEAGF